MAHGLSAGEIQARLEQSRQREQMEQLFNLGLQQALQNPMMKIRLGPFASAIGNEDDHKILLLGLPGGFRLEIPLTDETVKDWVAKLSEPLTP